MPSLIHLQDHSKATIQEWMQLSFSLANEKGASGKGSISNSVPKFRSDFAGDSVGVLMFEPSTRTRLSFVQSCVHLGLGVLDLGELASSSITKGESVEDTLLNVQAMGPMALIVRCGDEFPLDQFVLQQAKAPVLCAGWGKKAHPTQALLDLYTLWVEHQAWWFRKILFVGDFAHSRVAASWLQMAQIFNLEIGVWAPKSLSQNRNEKEHSLHFFEQAEQALPWADVVIGLRTQYERHGEKTLGSAKNPTAQLQKKHLALIGKKSLILHPGPVNWGEEFQTEIAADPRSRILQQVKNGVFVRQALLMDFLNKSPSVGGKL